MTYATQKPTMEFYIDDEEEHKIGHLRPLQKRVNTIFKVLKKGRVRTVRNRNDPDRKNRVCEFTVADETGSILLTAWNEVIEMLMVGEYFALFDGYVSIFKGTLRLVKGRFGEVIPYPKPDWEPSKSPFMSSKESSDDLDKLKLLEMMSSSKSNIGQGNVQFTGVESTS